MVKVGVAHRSGGPSCHEEKEHSPDAKVRQTLFGVACWGGSHRQTC